MREEKDPTPFGSKLPSRVGATRGRWSPGHQKFAFPGVEEVLDHHGHLHLRATCDHLSRPLVLPFVGIPLTSAEYKTNTVAGTTTHVYRYETPLPYLGTVTGKNSKKSKRQPIYAVDKNPTPGTFTMDGLGIALSANEGAVHQPNMVFKYNALVQVRPIRSGELLLVQYQ